MSINKEFDLLVIGAGSGGIALANRAAMLGAKVAVIEYQELGGTCVNRGCVPKKVMWNVAKIFHELKTSSEYGVIPGEVKLDFAKLLEVRNSYIDRIHNSYSSVFNKNNVTIINGWASFVDNNTIQVKDINGKETLYTAKHIAISPGSIPTKQPTDCDGIALTSDDFFELTELPKTAVIIGAGYIATEIAGVLSAFGTKVHKLVRSRSLREFDREIVDHYLEINQNDPHGYKSIKIDAVDKIARLDNGQVEITVKHGDHQHVLVADKLFNCMGRTPNIAKLGLENTSIKVDSKKFIEVDEYQNTNVPGVYALGDVINGPQLTPAAISQGRKLAHRLFDNQPNSKADFTYVPTVIFSHPAIGTVGLSEEKAIEKYGAQNIKVYRSSFTDMKVMMSSARYKTLFKLVCLGAEEKIIGLHGVGEGIEEIIQGFATAIVMGATKADFDRTLAIHPTAAEEIVTMR